MSSQKSRKVLEGVVTSTKMAKTIVVRVDRFKMHSLYKKRVKVFKSYKAHDPKEAAQVGEKVRIIQTRPLSKDKHFRLLEIVKQ